MLREAAECVKFRGISTDYADYADSCLDSGVEFVHSSRLSRVCSALRTELSLVTSDSGVEFARPSLLGLNLCNRRNLWMLFVRIHLTIKEGA